MKIKEARKIKGFTQRQLANELNVEFSLISKYESGRLRPTQQRLVSIAKILGLSPESFFSEYGYSSSTEAQVLSTEALDVANLYDMLDTSDQKILMDLVTSLYNRYNVNHPESSANANISTDAIFVTTPLSNEELSQLRNLFQASFLSYDELRTLLWNRDISYGVSIFDLIQIKRGTKHPSKQLYNDIIDILEHSIKLIEYSKQNNKHQKGTL